MARPFALVTGGSSGIGLELARLLAEDDHDLLIGGSSARVHAAAEELRGLGGEVIPVQSDLATADGTRAVWQAAVESCW